MEETKPSLVAGKVYLIPTTLGDGAPLEVLPISIKRTIENIDHYIVENEKTARRFIKKVSPSKSQPDLHIEPLNKYTDPAVIPSYLDPCIHGHDVGVLSEAGCPGIADPGGEVVRVAHEKRIQVVPLVGPSSILMAMMSSGMNGQNFAFNGYLPIEGPERKAMIKKLERTSRETGQAQIFMETPYRNDKLLKELTRTLQKNTRLCVATDITLPTEFIQTKIVHEWSELNPDLNKRPTIFIIQA
ncbi:SAM-dependent methyltransferase [Flagellimonas allohymeniacidonis]|uniref:SAM-dependent methyltransferase n=1 Tax=Flagellimonas allohymeniacidonis TaxID=2517819 RepID=A0A4Q8QH57_9FLAO|nr:SAM-dependent methyltransferase [Allomuricauda hymeniacidonis]TAI49087.1 SAM-dependent methyltransferase [Allomuricauda hymeniacidonis]